MQAAGAGCTSNREYTNGLADSGLNSKPSSIAAVAATEPTGERRSNARSSSRIRERHAGSARASRSGSVVARRGRIPNPNVQDRIRIGACDRTRTAGTATLGHFYS